MVTWKKPAVWCHFCSLMHCIFLGSRFYSRYHLRYVRPSCRHKCVQESKVLLRGSSGQRLYSKACSYSWIILWLSRCSKPWKRMRPCISSQKFGDRTTPCVWILTRAHLVGKKQMKAKFCCKQKTCNVKFPPSFVVNTAANKPTPLCSAEKKKQLFLQFTPIRQNLRKKHTPTYLGLIWTYLNLFELIYKYRISNL